MASKFNRPKDVAKPATPQAAAKKNIDAELGFSSMYCARYYVGL